MAKSKFAPKVPRRAAPFEHGILDCRPAVRTCLMCGEGFPSLGPAHRICDKCRDKFRELASKHDKWAW